VQWPSTSDVDAWTALANRALQLQTLQVDAAESAAWDAAMRELVDRGLPYREFIMVRMEALSERLRRRKLDQKNLRWKYGFREGTTLRRAALVRRDVRRTLVGRR
jgi:hypothetical protein